MTTHVLSLCEMLLSLPPGRRGPILLSVLAGRPVLDVSSDQGFDVMCTEFLGRFETQFKSAVTLEGIRNVVASTLPVNVSMEFGRLMMPTNECEMLAVIDQIVARLTEYIRAIPRERQRWLFDVATDDGSCQEAVTMPAGGSVSSLTTLVENGDRFSTIYADPPWEYENSASRGAANNHYDTMSLDAICREPVNELAAENCHLHLWTTSGFLREAFQVIEAWGFEYKSGFVWVKPELGMGNYWRLGHEYLLLGVRGRLTFCDRTISSWLEAPRTVHSRKPSAIRRLIERVSPGPYLELYGREALPNSAWTVYGNQIEPRLF